MICYTYFDLFMEIKDIVEDVCYDLNIHDDKFKKNIYISLSGVEKFYRESPVMMCLGGIPGVGKSTYSIKIYKEDFYIINPDYYRTFCLEYTHLNTTNLIDKTSNFVTLVCNILIQCLCKLSCNILIEDTFANYSYWKDYLHNIHLNRYKKIFILLSAPIYLCYEATQIRYHKEATCACIIPRKVEMEFVVNRAKNLYRSVNKYYNSCLFEEFIIMYRDTIDAEFEQIPYKDYLNILSKELLPHEVL